MKLMIDIDDELYEQALRDQCYHEVTGLNDINDYSLTIANGIPVSSEDDLINRSVLKKAFEEVYPLATNDMGGVVNKRIYDIIDNAPAVNIPQGKWHEGFHEGFNARDMLAEVFNERPQGKWKLVYDINNDINVVCPFCNKTRIFAYAHGYSIEEVKSQLQEVNDLPNYCENCGADMRKDGTE